LEKRKMVHVPEDVGATTMLAPMFAALLRHPWSPRAAAWLREQSGAQSHLIIDVSFGQRGRRRAGPVSRSLARRVRALVEGARALEGDCVGWAHDRALGRVSGARKSRV
jgi:hypothetical protein